MESKISHDGQNHPAHVDEGMFVSQYLKVLVIFLNRMKGEQEGCYGWWIGSGMFPKDQIRFPVAV
jgi:hypothetical protein